MKTTLFIALMTSALTVSSAWANFNSVSYNSLKSKQNSITYGSEKKPATLILARLGGDEVGNGGDDIRLSFIKISEQILNDSPEIQNHPRNLAQLKKSITIKNIFVMDQLKIDGVKASFAVSENAILLDRQSWNSLDGILADKLDPRLEILRLLATASEVNYTEDELLSIYSTLPQFISPNNGQKKSVAPLCMIKESSIKEEKNYKTFSKSSKNIAEAKSSALKACMDESLSDCRILEAKESGFAGFMSFSATAQGFKATVRSITKKEQKQERCQELQRCSSMYELAPTGQIPSESFNKLDMEISASCQ